MNDYILIEYSNSTDMGGIVYQNTFENKVYLNADVSKPEYELVEEGIENGDGEFFPDFQKWEKKYTITFYAQEFLVDALTLMTLHDQIYVTLKNGESSKVTDIEVDYTWDSNIECWAEVVIKFTTDYITISGCNENMTLCLEASVTCASAYDADGAGSGTWNNGDSIEPEGTIAFFYTSYSDGLYTGTDSIPVGFYRSTNGAWVLIELEDGDVGDVTDLSGAGTCIFLIKSGEQYSRIPYIYDVIDLGGGDAGIYAVSLQIENTFFQVQYDNGGWTNLGSPQPASAFDGGFAVSPTAGTWDFRIYWYTHSCAYGYSNEFSQTIT